MADEIPAWARDDFDPESREAIERLRTAEARDPYEERSFEQIDYPQTAPDPYEERPKPASAPARNAVVDRALRLTSDEFQSNSRPVVENGQINWGDQELGGSARDFFRADAARMAMEKAASEPRRTQFERPSGSTGSGRGATYASVAGTDSDTPVLRAIRGAESSNNPRAQNPRSSAGGLYQFTDGTWGNVLRRMNPQAYGGYNNQQLKELKFNADLQEAAAQFHLNNDIMPVLQKAGIPATPGNIYLSWFQGPQGAIRAYRAPSDAKVSDVFPETVAANAGTRFRGKPYAQWTMDELREFTSTAMSRRMRASGGRTRKAEGGPVVEKYHGTDVNNLAAFDPSKSRTAKYHYLADRPETAQNYGEHVYSVKLKPKNMISFHPENIGPKQSKVVNELAERLGEDPEYLMNAITSADGSFYGGRGSLQDSVMDELKDMGYDAVRFPDVAHGGSWDMSTVVLDNNIVDNIEKHAGEPAKADGGAVDDEEGVWEDAYHATHMPIEQFDLSKAGTGTTVGGGKTQRAIFLTNDAENAHTYLGGNYVMRENNPHTEPMAHDPQIGRHYMEGANILPLKVNTKDFDVWDYGGNMYDENHMNELIKEARKNKVPGIQIDNIKDQGYMGLGSGRKTTTYVVLDPARIRSKFAKFDPKKTKKRDLMAANGGVMDDDDGDEGITAYHGSPYDFPKFDISKIDTGEGAQAYGHGLYFAESEPVAKGYRDRLRQEYAFVDGEKIPHPSEENPESDVVYKLANQLYQMGWNTDQAVNFANKHAESLKEDLGSENFYKKGKAEHAQKWAESIAPFKGKKVEWKTDPGHMYEVRINAHPDQFLDWDAPLRDQPEPIRRLAGWDKESESSYRSWWNKDNQDLLEALEGTGSYTSTKPQPRPAGSLPMSMKGSDLYEHLQNKMGATDWPTDADSDTRSQFRQSSAQRVSEYLSDNGIRGIKYLDAGSRSAGEGSRNYVVFNHDHVDIKRKYARGGAVDVG